MSGIPLTVGGQGTVSTGSYISPGCVLITVNRGAFVRSAADAWEPLTPEQFQSALLRLGV